MTGLLKYSSNNSGGSWWLSDQNWKDLEAEGWKVRWYKDDPFYNGTGENSFISVGPEGRWLGGLASEAEKEFPSMGEGIAQWERITSQRAADNGCSCCGNPHSFTFDGPYGTEWNDTDSWGDDDDW